MGSSKGILRYTLIVVERKRLIFGWKMYANSAPVNTHTHKDFLLEAKKKSKAKKPVISPL